MLTESSAPSPPSGRPTHTIRHHHPIFATPSVLRQSISTKRAPLARQGTAATRVETAATSSRSAQPSHFVRTRTGVASPVALLTEETDARVRVERWRMRVERVVDIYRHCQYVTFLQMLILASRACARSDARTHVRGPTLQQQTRRTVQEPDVLSLSLSLSLSHTHTHTHMHHTRTKTHTHTHTHTHTTHNTDTTHTHKHSAEHLLAKTVKPKGLEGRQRGVRELLLLCLLRCTVRGTKGKCLLLLL